ncbi:MAG: hypothetical protein D6725_00355 [Planctomycetota bacterium]|nr:MAG: hypothetical protein D6725_00355 [Planctomycetota bacterium]
MGEPKANAATESPPACCRSAVCRTCEYAAAVLAVLSVFGNEVLGGGPAVVQWTSGREGVDLSNGCGERCRWIAWKRRTRGVVGCVALLSALLSAGCWTETYNRRLEETRRYFEYLAEVNAALQSRHWQEFGIDFRPPKGFEELPAPVGPEADPETPFDRDVLEAFERRDPRQPRHWNPRGYLPGLVGAWRAVLPIDGQEDPRRPCELYILSNYRWWLAREFDAKIEPERFRERAIAALAHLLRIPPPESDKDWEWVDEKLPRGLGYKPKKLWTTITIETELAGRPTDVSIYRYEPGAIQIVLVLAVPQGVDRVNRLYKAFEHALVWMKVDERVPRRRSQSRSIGF